MQMEKESYRNSKWIYYLTVAALTFSFFVSDPTLSSLYIFYCTYRIQTVVKLMKIAAMVIVSCLFVYRLVRCFWQHERIHWGFIPCYLLIYFGYLVSCFVNADSAYLPRWLDALSSTLIPLLVFNIFSDDKDSFKFLIRVFSACYLVLAVFNLIFYLFPQMYIGEAKEWRELFFLGSKNRAGWPMMLGAFFHLLNDYLNNRKAETIIYLILLLLNSLIIACVTSLAGVFVLLVYYFIPPVKQIFQKWHFAVFILFSLVLFVILMWFLIPITVSKPVWFLLSLLGKGPGLSDRYDIWETGVKLVISYSPFFGFGLLESTAVIPHVNNYGITYHHAHNEFLQCWFEGGMLTILIVIFTMFFVAWLLEKCKDRKLVGICKMTLFSFLLMLQGDILPYYPWYMVALIANCSILLSEQSGPRKYKENVVRV